MTLLCKLAAALAAGFATHFAVNWPSDQAREDESKGPKAEGWTMCVTTAEEHNWGPGIVDHVAETLAGDAAGQARIVAEAEAITRREAQSTVEFPAVTDLGGKTEHTGDEDVIS